MTGTCGKAELPGSREGDQGKREQDGGPDLTVPFGVRYQWSQDLPLTLPVKGSTAS